MQIADVLAGPQNAQQEKLHIFIMETKAMVQAVVEIEDLNRQALLGRKHNEMMSGSGEEVERAEPILSF